MGPNPTLILGLVLYASVAQAQPSEHAQTGSYNKALGVECTHCHVDGAMSDKSKPTFDFALRMSRMVRGLSDGPLKPLGGITCWSCHRGQTTPARLPRESWESITNAHTADFAGGRDNLGLSMGVYSASLGVDCVHCHTPGNWKDGSKRPHVLASTTMSSIFEVIPAYFDPAVRAPRTQCYMCHQGSITVPRAMP